MDIFEYIDRVKANFSKQPEPRYNMKKYFMGGSVTTPKRGLVDEPGSYAGEAKTKHLGGGLYVATYKKGSKAYFTQVYDRETGGTKKKFFGSDKKAAAKSLKKQKEDRPPTKFEKIKQVKEIKGTKEFQKITDKIDNKFSKIESKGYTNLRKFRDEMKNLVTKDKFRNQFEIEKKISGYITDKFKDIQDVNTSSMEKALDKYNKAGGKERGTIGKIANEFGINKNTFKLNIQKTGRKTIPIKYGSAYEKSKAVSDKRKDAELKFSDRSFESKMSGTEAVQKSHMDDIYSRVVTAETMGYAPKYINQEILKDADAYLNALYKKRDKLLKDKPKGYKQAIEEINEKGIRVASATKGYKSFQIMQPDGSTYQFGVEPSKTIDPTRITEGKEIKGNVEKVKFKPQMVVTKQLEGPDKGKITKEKFGGKKATATLTPDPIDQYFFEKNRKAVMESQAKVTKKKMKSIANVLAKAGFRCGAAEGLTCDNPKAYFKDIKIQTERAKKGQPDAIKKFQNAGDVARKSKGLLKGTVYGILGEAGFEGAFVLNDILSGMPVKEAFQRSLFQYVTPKDFGRTKDAEISKTKRIVGDDPRSQQYVKDLASVDKLMSLYDRYEETDSDVVDAYTQEEKFKAEEDLRNFVNNFDPKTFERTKFGSPEQQAFAVKEEVEDVNKIKRAMDIDPFMFDRNVRRTNTPLFSDIKAKQIGRIPIEDKLSQIAAYGGVSKLSSGGIASGPPPEKGPQSQGLAYLMKNGKR